ncbi:MAG: GTP pyrophosphokinase [Candidatus Rokubacteria bacterium RIFCSPHIGHO2_12_FULL_73_22]|nr:MAG: GTP pyrophosphokinase [Candidatus Rokubacteria bacterium RIFCSPHIGHO2_12_FULL_73_22]OGL02037.1 MAG: GTP pyrophosphokinase [Candidatus Rokubacteria bacterium RIFCSPHIGHO2_02_FULL_73_26]OGL13401.1 MAG: GTP pyrophosphokinase [Candidatus Rokubacteria bacterium RIFCSPLOWO2_02_FULL_73_56]OGL28317.1 MAG: GTP pyrophosphokinase [Candidatus Rokubacteria bacterium RIFCSPLOWO2_12_FULL_73_47]
MTQLQTLLEEIPKYQPGADLALLTRAYDFSAASHKGQQRASGEPYLSHPLEVAHLLVDFKMDVTTVTAGLLHDVLEDTKAKKADLEREFGDEIAELVDGVTKIGKLAFSSREERQAENFRKMLVAMARDLRVLMIKLADRLHNMRTLDYLPPDRARKIAQETLDIYAPLAHRLGMAKVKAELEDLALRTLQPEAYVDLQKRVAKRRLEREADINQAIAIIERKLSEVGIEAKIRGRPKHFFSIWKKMHDQGREFDEIYDLTAVRVVTTSVRDCYGALGVIHSLWKPVPGRFKDFIAMPKVNMYQSLHTTVIGPKGDPVEIQIRTREMHRIAEEGIAAHWLYKEKRSGKDKLDESLLWLRQLLETQQDTKDPREFMDSVRVDLFPDEVYVFTPKGDVKALPESATPIDFAYAVHTKVGEHCVGAKVNGKLVPLRYTLQQGDIVEIVTSPNQHPSRDWLKIVKSNRARAKINQWLKVEERARSIELGRELFEREAKKYHLNPTALLAGEELKKIAADLGYPGPDDLLAAVGYGKSSVHQLLNKLAPNATLAAPEKPRPSGAARARPEQGVRIRGVDDLLVRFAKCCNPLPGDQIVGFITRGRGLTVHARECLTVAKSVLDRERLINVEWDVEEPGKRPVRIAVYIGRDRPGLLTEITGAISSRNGNITKAEVTVTEDRRGINHFVIEVADLGQLQDIIGAIREVRDVMNVERVRGL